MQLPPIVGTHGGYFHTESEDNMKNQSKKSTIIPDQEKNQQGNTQEMNL